ncbi:MAG: glycosyltransferase [Candidatus Woesearchaeota archaeon]
MRKIVMCGNFNFPRGSAISNYIQYLAFALIECGFEVVIISSIENSFLKKKNNNNLYYKGIKLKEIKFSENKLIKNFQLQFLQGKMIIKELDNVSLNSNDIIFVSSSVNVLQKKIREYANRHNLKTVSCVLEWYDSSFFKFGKLDFRYWKYLDTFYRVYPKHDALIPISTYIDNHFKEKGCKTLLLPIMADTSEYLKGLKNNRTKKFIFPANGKMKDDLEVMLKTISLVYERGFHNIEFHFCGIKEDIVKKYFKSSYDFLNNKLFYIHKWMEYEDLIGLYREMNFLFISRRTSQQTLANFPSKVPEAMTYGVIPVVTKVGDYTELYLEDGIDSIQFLENDIDSCFKAIVRAIELTEERQRFMSDNAYKCVKNKFDYNNWIPAIKNFFNSL